jgi:hypothetical protein
MEEYRGWDGVPLLGFHWPGACCLLVRSKIYSDEVWDMIYISLHSLHKIIPVRLSELLKPSRTPQSTPNVRPTATYLCANGHLRPKCPKLPGALVLTKYIAITSGSSMEVTPLILQVSRMVHRACLRNARFQQDMRPSCENYEGHNNGYSPIA